MQNRPGWLTTLSIIAICLGCLGFLVAALGAAQLLVGEKFQAALMQAQQFGGNNAMMEQQMKMQEEIQAVANQWKGLNLGLFVVQFFLSAGFVVGGIQAFRMRPMGRSFLQAAFAVAIIFEVVRAVPTFAIQREMAPIMSRYMNNVMRSAGPRGAAAPRAMGSVMKTSMYLGMAFGAVWMLAKCGVYISGVFYLRSKAIRALFNPEPMWIADDANPELNTPL